MIFKNNKSQASEASQETQEQTQSVDLEAAETASAEPAEQNQSEKPDAEALEQAKRVLQASKMLALRFGEIVGLLMRTPSYKHYTLTDMEWMVVPPLLNNQVIIAEARSDEKGLALPVGLAFWASVSDEVDAKLGNNLDRPVRLHPSEWNSGEHLWLIDVLGPPQIVQGLLGQLGSNVFGGKPYKVRHRDKDGKKSVRVIEPKAEQKDGDSAEAN